MKNQRSKDQLSMFHDPTRVKGYMPPEIGEALNNGAALIISVSGGKDSDCMALELAAARDHYGWAGPMALIHADVGRMEWKQSIGHCERLAQRLGVELFVVRHAKRDLLDGIHHRMEVRPDVPPFPSSAARWCTSDFKRAVIDKWLRNNIPDGENAVCTIGYRREESTSREKKDCFDPREDASAPTKNRYVFDWHPLLEYTEEEVWSVIGYTMDELAAIRADVAAYRVGRTPDEVFAYIDSLEFKAHPAYALGNQRVSCAICVLASKNDHRNGAWAQPELHQELIQIEDTSNFWFQQARSLRDLDVS